MMDMKWRLSGAAILGCLLLAPVARAQAASGLADVQKAYADVDYERTRALAAATVRLGNNDRAATSQLYLLWATAAAALDQTDEARTAFTYALATNPGLMLDRSLSPKIRAPYLEAKGALSGTDGKPALDVSLRRRKQELELALTDALHVATTVVISTRANEAAGFTRRRLAAAPTRRVPTPNGSELQFFVRVLDRYDNVLFELGTEDDPERLVSLTSSKQEAAPKPAGGKSPVAYYVTSGALAALGVTAGSLGTVMYLRREDAAREWNGSACEQPGQSRAQQCQGVDDRRKRAEQLSIGLFAAGGALLVGSVVSLVLAPASSRESVALDASPDRLMLRLRTSL